MLGKKWLKKKEYKVNDWYTCMSTPLLHFLFFFKALQYNLTPKSSLRSIRSNISDVYTPLFNLNQQDLTSMKTDAHGVSIYITQLCLLQTLSFLVRHFFFFSNICRKSFVRMKVICFYLISHKYYLKKVNNKKNYILDQSEQYL